MSDKKFLILYRIGVTVIAALAAFLMSSLILLMINADLGLTYYTMIIKEDGRKIKLLLDLTEEMLHTIKTQHPEKVYFA